MLRSRITRRTLLSRTALATTALVAAPYIRGAHAAGKLSIGFWDHWVPGANNASKTLCEEWGEKNKVEVSIDYITSQGNKNLLTIAAESQARSGHDIFAFPSWLPSDHANRLEPVDDIMAELIKINGKVNPTVEYLAHNSGRWVAVPACVGSQIKGPCSRIDLMKQLAGIDVLAMYPAGSPPKADNWTLDVMLKAAEACHKGGHPFGIGWAGPKTTSTPRARSSSRSAPSWSMPRATSPSRPTACAARSNTTRSCRNGCRQTRRPGTTLQQQIPRLRQGRADHEPAERLGGRQARRAEGRRAALDPRHARRARRAATRRSCPTSGASGASARTSRPPRACCCTSRSRRPSRRWWSRAAATICRRSRS